MLMVTRFIRVETYYKELPPINSHMKWPCEVKWQIKYIIYPPVEDLCTPN